MPFDVLFPVLAMLVAKAWHVYQANISRAFVNGDIYVDLYFYWNALKYRLNKTPYILKQSPCLLHEKLWVTKEYFRFTKLKSFGCMSSIEDDKLKTSIFFDVDDAEIFSATVEKITWAKNELKYFLKLRDLDSLRYYLGLTSERKRKIVLAHGPYCRRVLKLFGMEFSKFSSSPVVYIKGTFVIKAPICKAEPISFPFRPLTESLVYVSSRILFSVGGLSRFLKISSIIHENALKQVLHTLFGTIRQCILIFKV